MRGLKNLQKFRFNNSENEKVYWHATHGVPGEDRRMQESWDRSARLMQTSLAGQAPSILDVQLLSLRDGSSKMVILKRKPTDSLSI